MSGTELDDWHAQTERKKLMNLVESTHRCHRQTEGERMRVDHAERI